MATAGRKRSSHPGQTGTKARAGSAKRPRRQPEAMTVAEAAEIIGPDMAEELADLVNVIEAGGRARTTPAPDRRELAADRDLLVLQVPESFGLFDGGAAVERYLGGLTCALFAMHRRQRRRGQVWAAFIAHGGLHVDGLTVWLGFGKNVPGTLVHQLQAMVREQGGRTGLEYGRLREHGFQPLLALSDDGLELPPAGDTLIDEDLLEALDAGPVVRRRFRLV